MKPELILINPWIYDFAAYDLWSKPLGLLYIASYLRNRGFRIHFIDCLDVHHPGMDTDPVRSRPVRRAYGTGKFWREKIPSPSPLRHIPKSYCRYGISESLFVRELERVKNPAAVLVTSLMTYWYPGVRDAIALAKKVHPGVPVFLGGIYARLCQSHAIEHSGAHRVVDVGGIEDLDGVGRVLEEFGIQSPEGHPPPDRILRPAFDMLRRVDYICIMTSAGCPYRCQYCASRFLTPRFLRRNPDLIMEEILHWHRDYRVRDFAFYDDALLVNAETRIGIVLEDLIRRGLRLRFHTPNALHVREISAQVAELLYLSGFRTIRLGFETSDMDLHKALDRKVSEGEFEGAVRNLIRAGFTKKDIGAYILTGLPGQTVESVADTVRFVGAMGATPHLAEYSPIPHTTLWEKAVALSEYDLASEPLYHNNTLLPCWDDAQRAGVLELKRMVREIRQAP